MQVLDRSFHDPLYSSNPDLPISTFEAQAFAIFDIIVLSHVAKASKPIIGVRHHMIYDLLHVHLMITLMICIVICSRHNNVLCFSVLVRCGHRLQLFSVY